MPTTLQRTLALCCLVGGCAASDGDSRSGSIDSPDSPRAGDPTPAPPSFDNPNDVLPAQPVGSIGMPEPTGCEPGVYLGTYDCEVDLGLGPLPLTGDVSFDLEIREAPAQTGCQEFCVDLAIANGTGTLFGLAGAIGFESALTGGLDCRTGEFRATVEDGVYGAPEPIDPNDANSLWTVADPPFGDFTGSLGGKYARAAPQSIEGTWKLEDGWTGTTCAGPFRVKLTKL